MVDSIILSMGDLIANMSDLPIEARCMVVCILQYEEKIRLTSDLLNISLYKIQIDLLTCMLRGVLFEYLKKFNVDNDTWVYDTANLYTK